jgi:hypothetical protein
VIERNPTAGLADAYRWMNSGDPYLLLAATATFTEIPADDEEAQAARTAYDRAIGRLNPGCSCAGAWPRSNSIMQAHT